MFKFALIASGFLLAGACTQISQLTETTTTDMKSCLMSEAQSAIQDGSAFAAPVRTTVRKMSTICLNKIMAPQDQTPAVVSETKQEAQNILTTLMSAANGFK